LRAEVEALRPTGGVRFQELASLLAKVQASLDDREKRRIEPDLELLLKYQRSFVGPGPKADIDPNTWRAAVKAILTSCCLEFDYQPVAAETAQWRKIVCAGLLNGPITYVVGFMPDLDRPPVLYRLDRMKNARVTEDPAQVPSTFDLDEWLIRSFGIWREESRLIKLRIFPESSERARNWRFHPRQEVTELEDGGLNVTFRAGGLREIAEHLFQWAGELVVEQPEELREVLRQRLEVSRRMLGDQPTTRE
jgi:predicted DNA-binding transcriptional regulator YafY